MAYEAYAGAVRRLAAAVTRAERGSVTLMLLILCPVLIAFVGLVIDGGARLDQAAGAQAAAEEGARAGAGVVNRSAAYSSAQFVVDQRLAIAAARSYLDAAGYRHFTVSAAGPTSIRVSVTVTSPTRLLPIIGIDFMTSTGTAVATLATGVTGTRS